MPEQNDGNTPPKEPAQTPDSSGAQPSSPGETAGATPDPAQQQPRDDAGRFTSVNEYRFSQEDVQKHGLPTWAVGRTPVEVTQLGNTFYQQALTGQPQQQTTGNPAQQQPYQPQPQQQYAPPQAQPQYSQPTQEDWLNDPAAAAAKQQQWFQETQLKPQMTQMYTNSASQARQLVSMERPDAFQRYGPEIDSLLMTLDPAAASNAQNVRMVVDMIEGRHKDEIIEERAKQRAEQLLQQRGDVAGVSTPAGQVGTSAPGQNVLNYNVEELPVNYRELLQNEGLIHEGRFTPAFDEFISKTKRPGQTNEDAMKAWFEAAKGTDMIISSSGRGLRVETR